jgi:nitric oxide reductase subunit B
MEEARMETTGAAGALSPWWRNAAILVMIGGFSVLSLVTVATYSNAPPIPARFVDGQGALVFTGDDGQGTLNMGLAACFSALEVVPLTLLTLDAWDFIRLRHRRCEDCGQRFADRHRWAIYFLMAVGVWNFVGAGVFGFLINLPIVSYFEIGTTLTANHGHAALFCVFGMLALAVLVFCLRSLSTDARWDRAEKPVKVGFRGLNGGLALMVLIDLFPGGVLQLWDSIGNGYWHARRLTYLMSGAFHTLEWLRIVADSVFLLAGVVPLVAAVVLLVVGVFRTKGEAALAPGEGRP